MKTAIALSLFGLSFFTTASAFAESRASRESVNQIALERPVWRDADEVMRSNRTFQQALSLILDADPEFGRALEKRMRDLRVADVACERDNGIPRKFVPQDKHILICAPDSRVVSSYAADRTPEEIEAKRGAIMLEALLQSSLDEGSPKRATTERFLRQVARGELDQGPSPVLRMEIKVVIADLKMDLRHAIDKTLSKSDRAPGLH